MRATRIVLTLCLGLCGLVAIGVDRSSAQNIFYLNPQWVPYGGGSLPPPVIRGGFENGHDFPVCRAFAMGLQIPGKFLDGNCNVSYGGNGFSIHPPFEVLIGSHYPGVSFWIRGMAPDPTNIVPAGVGLWPNRRRMRRLSVKRYRARRQALQRLVLFRIWRA